MTGGLGGRQNSFMAYHQNHFTLLFPLTACPLSFPRLILNCLEHNMSSVLTRRRGSIDIVDAKVAVDLATAQSYRENVFLFIPNLIGKFTLCISHSSAVIVLNYLYRDVQAIHASSWPACHYTT